MDPNLWICELLAAQITSCSLSYYCHSILHTGSFASLDLDFFPVMWYKNWWWKENATFLSPSPHRLLKRKHQLQEKIRIPYNRKCNLEYLRTAELDSCRKHLDRKGENHWGSCWLENRSCVPGLWSSAGRGRKELHKQVPRWLSDSWEEFKVWLRILSLAIFVLIYSLGL